MYLHVGNGKSVRLEKIIGLFDLDTATVSGISKKFVTEAEKRAEVEYDYLDLPRTFVVTEKEEKNKNNKKTDRRKKYKIILSRISTSGLIQRAEGEE